MAMSPVVMLLYCTVCASIQVLDFKDTFADTSATLPEFNTQQMPEIQTFA
ncbi:hypothetical protein [Acidovorax kalamii]|jgi:hypothetical protein|nr:hypothetical protein [Acidovorax kalamii]MCO5355789.1 hypothetical protein [Acidovorax kalamii]